MGHFVCATNAGKQPIKKNQFNFTPVHCVDSLMAEIKCILGVKKQLIPIEYRLFYLQSVTARPLSHFGAQTTVSAFQFNTSVTGLQTVRTATTKTRGFALQVLDPLKKMPYRHFYIQDR